MNEAKRNTLNAGIAELLATQQHAQQVFKPAARGQLFRHTDGGIYRFVGRATHTEDQSVLYLYEHIWPFEPSAEPWARPAEMWASRFALISEQDLVHAMRQDRAQAQQAVNDAKAARRAEKEGQSYLNFDDVPVMRIVDRYTGEPLLPEFNVAETSGGMTQQGNKHE